MLRFQKHILGGLLLLQLVASWGTRAVAIWQSSGSDTKSTRNPGPMRRASRGKFKLTALGEMKDENGVHFGVESYLSPDRVGMTVMHNQFASPVAAHEYFEKIVSRAEKIIVRGKKKDKAGKVVGERAELVVSAGHANESISAILWNFESDLYEIRSSSSIANRDLERYLAN